MSGLTSLSKHTEINALIAFVDLSRYMKTSVQMENSKVAMWIDSFYERVAQSIESRSGIVVKFVGDAALVVFEEKLRGRRHPVLAGDEGEHRQMASSRRP